MNMRRVCYWGVIYWHLACLSAYAQEATKAKQFVPNPAFQVTVNEKAMAKLLKESGYASVHLIPTDKLEKVVNKVLGDTAMYSKIDGWVIWRNLHKKIVGNRIAEKIKDDLARIYLYVSEPYFFGTYLNEPLQAGKTYKITCQFLHEDKTDNLAENDMPELGFCFLPESPKENKERLKPQKKYSFKWNPEAKNYKRRREVIEKYQRENGGDYNTKEWKDFQGIRVGKDKYETITLAYQAQGGEKYLVFGNFAPKKVVATNPIKLTLYRFYVHEVGKPSTIDEK